MYSHWNSSYVSGYDNITGWGHRYFFTYFNEFGGRHVATLAVELTLFLIIFVLSIVANVAIALCVFRFSDMKTVTNSFVLNLAAADLLFACSIPPVVVIRLSDSWTMGNVACKLIPYSQYVAGVVLLWTLTLISMDRRRCIVVPPYRSQLSSAQAHCAAALIWIVTSVLFLPVAFWFRIQATDEHPPREVCTLVFPLSTSVDYALCFVVGVILFACLLPMGILIYNYQAIFKKILSTKNTWASSCVTVSTASTATASGVSRSTTGGGGGGGGSCCNTSTGGSSTGGGRRYSEISLSDILTPWPRKYSTSSQLGSLSRHEEIRLHKHVKAVRVLFLNVVMVLLMWLPITVTMGLIFLDGRRPTADTNFFLRSHHFVAALLVAHLNTIVNPVLYGVLSDNFRACLLRMCESRSPAKRNGAHQPVNGSGSKAKAKKLVRADSMGGGNNNCAGAAMVTRDRTPSSAASAKSALKSSVIRDHSSSNGERGKQIKKQQSFSCADF